MTLITGLVGGRAARPDDGQRHQELAARGGEGVAGAAQLRHAVDAEVGVHELHDGSEAVHALAQRLADEVALVDDLVRGAQAAEGLLGELGDVVGGAGLQVLCVDHRGGVAQHLLQHRQVDGVADRDGARLRQRSQALDVRSHGLQLARIDGARSEGLVLRGHGPGIVVGVGGVRVLQLLGQRPGGRRRGHCEVHGRPDRRRGRGPGRLQLLLAQAPAGQHRRLEQLDGVGLCAGPALLLLAAPEQHRQRGHEQAALTHTSRARGRRASGP
mmetsp:Transcript_7230/g.10758  ORF Transcript_7230/g.10758 Transcript_7230/m.10758 type:complete len:271 (+) Transcript_7230:104-916(+)